MKRFFLIPLLTLFTCVNMWADPVEVSTINDLQTQLAAGHDVKLMADITITTTKAVSINSTVTLDLNGHSLIDAASYGNMFSFADAASSAVTFTIKNGYITKTSTSTCYYPIRLYNLNNMSVVLEDVTIAEGSKFALLIYTKSKAAGNPSVTIQGTCAIPVIGFGGYSDISLVNVANSTLNTAFKLDSYGTARTIKLTNNGTLNLGASTQITCKLTKEGTGACTVAPGAEFSENAWTNLELDDYCTSHSYVAETVIQPNSWTLAKKIFTSAPARKAQFGDNQYASVQVAMAVAYAAGGEQTVTLLADDDYETTAKIMSDADITLDLNHHVLTVKQKIDFECGNGYHGKLTVRDGEITSSTSSEIFSSLNTTVTNEKPELILENVIVTNTYHNTEEYLSSRGKCFRTYGFFKLTLSGTTDCPVYLDLYKGNSWANYFELTNNTQSKIYVMGYASEYGRSNALSYYITDNTLLDKFGASNTNWEIWQGYIKADIKDTYLSHIKGAVNEEVLEIGPDGEEINAYWITEEGLPVVATVNGTNYYTLADALEASTSDHPAQLAGDVSAATINVRNGNNCYLDLNNHTLTLNSGVSTSQNSVENGQLHFVGTGTVNTSHPFNITGSTNASASNYSVLTIGENVTVNYSTLNNNYPYAIWVAANDSKAYGVRVDLAGTLNSNKSGAYINGTIQASTGNVPVFNISGGLAAKKLGIYAAGYGVWNITGAVDAATTDEEKSSGIAIKAGQLNINNGAVVSCKGDFERVAPYNNGVNIAGAALQIESNDSYAGAMQIAIADGATLTCNGGNYAIYEYAENVQTAVNTIAIAEGTNSKFKGGILISQSLAARGGFVSGGKWSVDVSANIVQEKMLLDNKDDDKITYPYLVGVLDSEDPDYKDYQEIVNDENKNAVLTNEDSEDADEITGYSSDNIGEVGADANVKTSTATNAVVVSENTDVVSTEAAPVVEVKKVTVEDDNTLTVTKGATLKVGAGAVLLKGDDSKIVVEPGATLVVDGLIYGATEEKLVIETNEQSTAAVLYAPETEFIKEDHPMATIKLTTKAKQTGANDYVYERFAIPTMDGNATTYGAENLGSVVTYDGGEFKQALYKWNGSNWEFMPSFKAMNPFQGYQLTNNSSNGEVVYTFEGNLVGNTDNDYTFVESGFGFFGNSYSADINIGKLFESFEGSDMQKTIWIYDYITDGFKTITPESYGSVKYGTRKNPQGVITDIRSMQAFLMNKATAGTATVDYASAIWGNPKYGLVGGGSGAPAKRVAADDRDYITIYVANETSEDEVTFIRSNEYSNAFDNGADASKWKNNGINLYVTTEEGDLAAVASDEIINLTIAFRSGNETEYTLGFDNLNGEEYAIRDILTGIVTNMSEGATYTFTQEANTTIPARFQIVGAYKMPTGMETIEEGNAVQQKVIMNGVLYILRDNKWYNAQGQFVK